MVDKKNNKKIEPPIKDTDGDGILSSKEIIAQLHTEEEQGSKRTPNERVHGVLEEMGLREYAQLYSRLLLGSLFSENRKANIREAGALDLQEGLMDAYTKKDHSDFEKSVAKRRSEIISSSASDEEKKLELSDVDSFVNFVQTAKETFPKGISIAPEDITGILAHFAPMPITIPKKEQQRTSGKRPSSSLEM